MPRSRAVTNRIYYHKRPFPFMRAHLLIFHLKYHGPTYVSILCQDYFSLIFDVFSFFTSMCIVHCTEWVKSKRTFSQLPELKGCALTSSICYIGVLLLAYLVYSTLYVQWSKRNQKYSSTAIISQSVYFKRNRVNN